MAKYIDPQTDQYRMVILNFDELFPPDHFLCRLLEMIRGLGLEAFDGGYSNDEGFGGRSALPPDRVLAILIYSLLYGNISMRNLERDMGSRAKLMFLSGGLSMDHSTMSVFRKRHRDAIEDLFAKVVFLGFEGGFIDLDTVCIDSTKIKASANRRDIGTEKELGKRLEEVKEACSRRFRQWEESADREDADEQKKRLEKLERKRRKLERALEFLKGNESRKRVHLNEPDADWQHLRSDSFIVGYSAHVAADSKTKMIVHKEVVVQQADSLFAVPMVEAVEELKSEMTPEKRDEIRYALDSGYSSEKNYEALEERDLYMPDRESVNRSRRDGESVTRKRPVHTREANYLPEKDYPDSMKFEYNESDDTFLCEGGQTLKFARERKHTRYHNLEYRTYRCSGCQYRGCCAGWDIKRCLSVAKSRRGLVKAKEIPVMRKPFPGGRKRKEVSMPFTVGMREKLKNEWAKKIYGRRFPVSEGVFGIMKSARRGEQFLRKGLERVSQEFTERCLAHNIACMLAFRRT